MEVELKLDGKSVLKARIRVSSLIEAIASAIAAEDHEDAESTPITPAQATELLSRVDTKSARFLKRIAENNGFIEWEEMQEIFDIDDDWNEYSTRFGKGITRALRNITGGNRDKLIYWDDKNWEEDSKVRVDGMALQSLREASGYL
ncbi:hypothetical protein ELG69_10480 [Rhizobium leguminosarum]|uniref:hypothetical protein n=1 Tax=Rhizobium leguminosarum TaxID=384 RepID=UPI0010311BAC|nr:hypothetical protein [Rhizobium leguminosarum]TBG84503.1 hypothetical protein ELG69_10480 [Rhizobium leguminosarum]